MSPRTPPPFRIDGRAGRVPAPPSRGRRENVRNGLDFAVDLKPYRAPVNRTLDRSHPTAKASHRVPPGVEGLRRELQHLGLRPYAARILLALLHAGSGNSAQLAELSGVPRTSIYQVMEGLARQGLVEVVPTHGPTVWTSQGWEAVIDVLDALEEERLREHHARTTRLRRDLAATFLTPG